jgi:hypothetical protein
MVRLRSTIHLSDFFLSVHSSKALANIIRQPARCIATGTCRDRRNGWRILRLGEMAAQHRRQCSQQRRCRADRRLRLLSLLL